MSSASDSDSNASGSRSASPAASQNSGRSRSASPADNASAGSRSRSQTPESNKSERSAASSPRSRQSRSRSRSNESNRSGGSNVSNRSVGSRQSAVSNRSGGSRRSNRSSSNRSTPIKPQSPAGSAKSGSTNRSRSRSSSPGGGGDKNSEAGSNKSSRSNSRSRSRSRSGSASPGVDSKRKTDSDDEKEKKRSKSGESDGEEDGGGEDKEVSAAAIFGDDADDISSEEEKEKQQQEEPQQDEEKEARSDQENENEEDTEMRQDDGDNEPETIPETRIDVQIPKISCDLGRDIHFVKLPNFLSVETRPFDPETYEDEIDEEETLDEEGRARLKLKVENTIRWRELMDKEGNLKKQSNARLVRWSDGSYSLHLGAEIFDVYKQPLQGDHNHLFIRQGTGLQGQAVFRTKLSFRPHSTESFTHRKMTLSLADRSQKIAGIKILSQVGADPDHDRKTLLKKEEEKLRQIVRASKPRKKGDTATRLHMNSSTYREDEGSDEDGAISLNAIKNKYKSGAAAKGGAIYSSDEEGSDIEARRARKLDKALKDSESSAESE